MIIEFKYLPPYRLTVLPANISRWLFRRPLRRSFI